MDMYRSDGEVGVQLYFDCTAMQPAIQKWGVRRIPIPENQATVDRKNCI